MSSKCDVHLGWRSGTHRVLWRWCGSQSRTLDLLIGWGWRAGGGFHVAVLDCCGPGLVPHLLVGLCVLFWRQGGGVGEEGPAPDPHGPQWEVDVWILVWLSPPFPVAMECPFLAWLMPTFTTTFRVTVLFICFLVSTWPFKKLLLCWDRL